MAKTTGQVQQILGGVVDVEFPAGELPGSVCVVKEKRAFLRFTLLKGHVLREDTLAIRDYDAS